MANPLSIVGSVVGIASLGIQVSQSLIDFYNNYKNQKSDLAKILRSLEDLKNTLQKLEKVWAGRTLTQDDQHLVEKIQDSVTNCSDAIDELDTACQKFTKITQPGLKKSIDTITHSLAYPFKKSTLQKLNIDIADIQKNLAFLLQIIQLKTTIRHQDDLDELKGLLESIDGRQISTTLREWLKAPDATVDHNTACEKKEKNPGSGTWLVDRSKFKNWLMQEKSFLWLRGFAGSGKSVLCSTAIQAAFQYRRGDRNIGIAFFYFSFNDESKQDESGMIRALLWQLSSQSSDGPVDLLKLYEAHKTGIPRSKILRGYLQRLFGRFHRVYIFLDALDECPRLERRGDVLETLEELQKWDLLNIHLFVTSRDETDIRQSLNHLTTDQIIEMRNAGIDGDITNFISRQLNEDRHLHSLSPYHDQIRIALTEGAKGVFRWVECQLRSLQFCPKSRYHVQKRLKSLPQSLDATYERMLSNIDDDSIEDARRILTLLCFAYRPLTVGELIDGIAVDIGKRPGLNRGRILQDVDDIRNICSGFIDVGNVGDPALVSDSNDQNRSTVRIAHFSVQEYLISRRILQSKAEIFSIDKCSAHAEIAQICLIYLLEEGLCAPNFDEHLVEQFPLSHFAAKYWHRHYKDTATSASKLDFLVLTLFQNPQSFAVWVKLHDVDRYWDDKIEFDQRIDKVLSPIYYASLLGLGKTLSSLVNEHPAAAISKQINLRECGERGHALQAASSNGHQNIVQLLLDKGADVDIQTDGLVNGTALQAASSNGHQNIVQLLLDKGADVNLQSGGFSNDNALQAASSNGHQNVVQFLLDKGADVKAQGGYYGTALQAASLNGHQNVVQFLLDKGADINAQGGKYGNALQAASYGGRQDLVQLLLDKGADVKAQDGYYGTALQAASLNGHRNVVQFLLDKGADINAQGGHYGNVLQAAVYKGQQDIVQLLLDKGADVNAQGGDHKLAPIIAALGNSHVDIIKLLLKHKADITNADTRGWTPLHIACDRGDVDIVKAFLGEGADPLSVTKLSETSLHLASRGDVVEIVDLLMAEAEGYDTGQRDGYGRTYLDWASQNPLFVSSRKWASEYVPTPEATSKGVLQKTIARLVDQAISEMTQVSFYDLGKCLLFAGDEPNAFFALQQFGSIECNRCSTLAREDYYMCRSCPDVDLCGECFEIFREDKKPWRCHSHDFVSIPNESASPGRDELEWLTELREQTKNFLE